MQEELYHKPEIGMEDLGVVGGLHLITWFLCQPGTPDAYKVKANI